MYGDVFPSQVRLATEGINGTVGGSVEAARLYTEATMAYPPFRGMTSQDFKVNFYLCPDVKFLSTNYLLLMVL